jgi:predicted nuclease with TOPRIM domain
MKDNLLEKAILAQVKEALPEEAGKTVIDYLGKLKEDAARVEELEVRIKALEKHKTELYDTRDRLKSERDVVTTERNELLAKHEEILQRERDIDVTLAVSRAAAAENKAGAIQDLVSSLFRNVEFRRSTFGTTPRTKVMEGDYGPDVVNTGSTVTESAE